MNWESWSPRGLESSHRVGAFWKTGWSLDWVLRIGVFTQTHPNLETGRSWNFYCTNWSLVVHKKNGGLILFSNKIIFFLYISYSDLINDLNWHNITTVKKYLFTPPPLSVSNNSNDHLKPLWWCNFWFINGLHFWYFGCMHLLLHMRNFYISVDNGFDCYCIIIIFFFLTLVLQLTSSMRSVLFW